MIAAVFDYKEVLEQLQSLGVSTDTLQKVKTAVFEYTYLHIHLESDTGRIQNVIFLPTFVVSLTTWMEGRSTKTLYRSLH